MTNDERKTLQAAAKANDANLPYKPGAFFITSAIWLAENGYLERGSVGGFYVSATGQRELRRGG
jgi:hypothetical protein